MAAILCHAIGDLCGGLSSGCEKICAIPCRVISAICKPVSDITSYICSSPFCFYMTVTIVLNVPPIALGFSSYQYLSNGSRGALWIMGDIPFCVANIWAAWYISTSIMNPTDPRIQNKTTMLGRARHLLCYDVRVAAYIVILILFVVWISVGADWWASGRINDADKAQSHVTMAMGCAYLFLFVGFAALSLSLCFAWCDGGNLEDNNKYFLSNVPDETGHDMPSKYPEAPPYVAPEMQNLPSRPHATNNKKSASSPKKNSSKTTIPLATPAYDVEPQMAYPYSNDSTTTALPLSPALNKDGSLNGGEVRSEAGSTVGTKIAKFLNVDEKRRHALESRGVPTAVHTGLSAAKEYVNSKRATTNKT